MFANPSACPHHRSSAADPVFVGATTIDGASGTVTWPAGTQAGDTVFFVGIAGSSGAVSWSGITDLTTHVSGGQVHGTSNYDVESKLSLAAGDVSSPPSYSGASGGGVTVFVYRNVTGITYETNLDDDSGSTLDIPGFVKPANTRLVLAFSLDRDPSTNMTPPSGFTERHEASITYFDFGCADIAGGDYVDNDTMSWTMGSSFNQAGFSVSLQ